MTVKTMAGLCQERYPLPLSVGEKKLGTMTK